MARPGLQTCGPSVSRAPAPAIAPSAASAKRRRSLRRLRRAPWTPSAGKMASGPAAAGSQTSSPALASQRVAGPAVALVSPTGRGSGRLRLAAPAVGESSACSCYHSCMSTTTIYARIPEELKAATDAYAADHGMTLANAVADLLGRGMEATTNGDSVKALEARARELQLELDQVRPL